MFEGFRPETIDFLWGIRMNNSREWFEPHKKDYVNYLYEPMKALGKELFEPFMEKSGTILKVSRIYRDARLHHPLPYKEGLWLCIRQEAENWTERPCLFFEMKPEGATYGFGIWQPRAATVETLHKDWNTHPQEILKLLSDTEKATGIPVTAGKTYKRPKPAPIPELQPLYNWRGNVTCLAHEDPGPALFSRELADRVAELFQKLLPLYDYFNRFDGRIDG